MHFISFSISTVVKLDGVRLIFTIIAQFTTVSSWSINGHPYTIPYQKFLYLFNPALLSHATRQRILIDPPRPEGAVMALLQDEVSNLVLVRQINVLNNLQPLYRRAGLRDLRSKPASGFHNPTRCAEVAADSTMTTSRSVPGQAAEENRYPSPTREVADATGSESRVIAGMQPRS